VRIKMTRYTFKVGNRDRGAYVSDEALDIQTSENVQELPEPIKAVTPRMKRVREAGFTTFEAPAGEHSNLEWYANVLEDRECEVVNIDEDRGIVSVIA
jgi:hypothetical protein